MVVAVVARQAVSHFIEFVFRQDGHPVEGFLAVDRDVVAERLEFHAWKSVVDAFGLLQADDVGSALGEPGARGVDPLLNGVHIPGRDVHALSSSAHSRAKRESRSGVKSCVSASADTGGSSRWPYPVDIGYSAKLVPQPHEAVAFGLLILKEEPIRSSTKSISLPAM